MKKGYLLALALLLSCPHSFAIERADLQGKWVITSVNGTDEGDRSDAWEFRGDDWIVWSSERPLPADPYTLNGNIIDLGYIQIKVLEHSADTLKTEQMGFVYTLKRL